MLPKIRYRLCWNYSGRLNKDLSGYGLWAIWNEGVDGGAVLFTFQYLADSFTYIVDARNHHDDRWQLTKTSLGDTCTITNIQSNSWDFNIVNLTK